MVGKLEVTRRILLTIAHTHMIHARVLEVYIQFYLMYTTDHIFPVLQIKYVIYEYSDTTTSFKLAIGTKPSVSNVRVLFCKCVIRKVTAHVNKKFLNMCHQAKKGFCSIFVGIPQHKKGYLVYIPSTAEKISS